jgi:hypothetical protein
LALTLHISETAPAAEVAAEAEPAAEATEVPTTTEVAEAPKEEAVRSHYFCPLSLLSYNYLQKEEKKPEKEKKVGRRLSSRVTELWKFKSKSAPSTPPAKVEEHPPKIEEPTPVAPLENPAETEAAVVSTDEAKPVEETKPAEPTAESVPTVTA